MKPALQPSARIVLYEGCGSRPLDDGARFAVVRALLEKGHAVTSVREGGRVTPEGVRGKLLVLGQFDERPPAEMSDAGGGVDVHVRDIGGLPAEQVVDLAGRFHDETQTKRPGGWKPWFPVLDYSRCTNCMQCLTFCLFDVYGVTPEKQIQVQNPSNCKTDCPACSRVCPEVAILFPKYKGGPINGDEVRQEDLQREKMKVDISALLGGDIYAALRNRSDQARARFARERDEKRALDERRKCLAKLQQALDVPPEVLAALPSREAIEAKTARALAGGQEPED